MPGVGSLRWACTFHASGDANSTQRKPVFRWNMGFRLVVCFHQTQRRCAKKKLSLYHKPSWCIMFPFELGIIYSTMHLGNELTGIICVFFRIGNIYDYIGVGRPHYTFT